MYQQPATLAIARFLGDTVLLPGTADGGGVATAVGTVAVSGDWPPGTHGLVVLRPEDLRVDGVGHPLTEAIVTSVRYHGHDALLTTQAGDLHLTIRVLGRPAFTAGDAVAVSTVREAAFFPDEGRDRERPGAPRTLDPQTRPPV
jgi:iron(III) transport system ATP-binding protein